MNIEHRTSNVQRSAEETIRDLQECGEKSAELQQALMARAGFVTKGHVNGQGIKFINGLAKRHGCRAWEDTRDGRDYDELLALLEFHDGGTR